MLLLLRLARLALGALGALLLGRAPGRASAGAAASVGFSSAISPSPRLPSPRLSLARANVCARALASGSTTRARRRSSASACAPPNGREREPKRAPFGPTMESVGLPFAWWIRRTGETGSPSEKTNSRAPTTADRTPRVGFPAGSIRVKQRQQQPPSRAPRQSWLRRTVDVRAREDAGQNVLGQPAGVVDEHAPRPSGEDAGGAKTPTRLSLAKTPAGKPKDPGRFQHVLACSSASSSTPSPSPRPRARTTGSSLPARKTRRQERSACGEQRAVHALLFPNATRAEFWLNKAIREEERSGDLAQAIYHIDAGIKRGAEPSPISAPKPRPRWRPG